VKSTEAVMTLQPAEVAGRLDANSSMLRLRSLVAMGHSGRRIARAIGVDHVTVTGLINGTTRTVTPRLYQDIIAVWGAWWDLTPPRRTMYERAAATKAIRRAAVHDWCCPAALDEDLIETPGYVPDHGWRYARGCGVADDYPLGIPSREAS
jgi:hypothetical protein